MIKLKRFNMEYTIEYLEDKKIVQVKVKGRVNFQIAQQYSMEARKLAHEYNCKKYLINHSKTSLEANIYKIHTDGDALEKFGFKNTEKVAIVISRDPWMICVLVKQPMQMLNGATLNILVMLKKLFAGLVQTDKIESDI